MRFTDEDIIPEENTGKSIRFTDDDIVEQETMSPSDFGVKQTTNLEKFKNEEMESPLTKLFGGPPQGGSFAARVGYAFKPTPRDKLNYLKAIYGAENIRLNPSKNPEDYPDFQSQTYAGSGQGYNTPLFAEFKDENGNWVRFNDDTYSVSDLAALPHLAIRHGPQVAASFVPGGQTPMAQGLTAAGGVAADKLIGGMLPGGTEESLPEQAAETVGTGLAVGGLTKAIGAIGGSAKKHLAPASRFRKKFNVEELSKTPFAKEADTLEEVSGTKFPLSTRFGSKKGYHLEGEARAMNPDLAGKADEANQFGFTMKFEQMLQRINPTRQGKKSTTEMAFKAIESEKGRVLEEISGKYKSAMELADKVTRGKKVIDPAPASFILQSEIDDLARMKTRAPEDEATIGLLRKLKDEFDGSGGLSFREADSWLKSQTAAASGTGRAISDLETAAARRADRIAKKAIEESIRFHTKTNTPSAQAADIYLKARRSYAEGMDYLKDLGSRSLGKLLNLKTDPTTGDIVKEVATKDADDIAFLMPIIERHEPAAATGLREHYLREIVEKSAPDPKDVVGPMPYVDFRKMARNFNLDDGFYARFPKGKAREEAIQLKKAIDRLAAEDLSAKGQGMVGRTQELAGLLGSFHPVFVLKALFRGMTPKIMGKYLLTEEGKQAIIASASQKPVNPAAIAKFTAFTKAFIDEYTESEMNTENTQETK